MASPSHTGAILDAWASSGAMALTGRPDRPLGPPAGLHPGMQRLADDLKQLFAEGGSSLGLDPWQALVDRAAIAGLTRHGDTSCGGHTRILASVDGWIAVSLAREEDVAAVPAWLGLELTPRRLPEVFEEIAGLVRRMTCAQLVSQGRLLGLPVAWLGSVDLGSDTPEGAGWEAAVRETRVAEASVKRDCRLLVVDMSSLWAGPLSSALLRSSGARVIKVESRSRPDGARSGPGGFFDLLNGGKESVALDFASPSELGLLRRLLAAADLVLEGSRPRALEQLGIDAREIVAASHGVWVSITGYGRADPSRNWVAFGDDAAVAGGLVVWDENGPCLCADAIADPLTGLVATAAGLQGLRRGGAVLIDVAMARVAAAFAGPTVTVPASLVPDEPLARLAAERAPDLDEHGRTIREEFAS
jgi:hypothetical protein